MRPSLELRALAATAALTAVAASASGITQAAPTASKPDPTNFTTRIDNPWYPLKPGTTLTYKGVKDGKPLRTVFRTTHKTKVVDGVRCRVVSDRAYSDGRLVERTTDYYVQDKQGTVWYYGEDTAELDRNGKVKTREGTWHSGVNGARAGIFMPAHPRVGESHLQEYYKGHAEDQFKVLSLHARIKVPYRSFHNALKTREHTRLEPGVVDHKYYVRGTGEVFEGSAKGPKEVGALVSVERR
jgi:hypothetical protein